MKNLLYIFSIFALIGLIYSCSSSDALAPSAPNDTGVAGSYARFLVVGDYMYIVDNQNIKTFDLNNPANPIEIDEKVIGNNIETIYHLKGNLFVGSGDGMFIYTIQDDGTPTERGEFLYDQFAFEWYPCDPVVVNDSIAFVTLHVTSEISVCRRTEFVTQNLLNIIDIRDLENPTLIQSIEMYRPKGVGLDGNILFVCEDDAGLKIFDVADPYNMGYIAEINDIHAVDVITLDGLLLVVGPEKVYQYDYTNPAEPILLSEIDFGV